MKRSRARAAAVAILSASILLSMGTEAAAWQAPFVWGQWRGPGRDGVGDAAALPAVLPEALTEVWRIPVGEGYSGPVVVDGTVYQFSRDNGREVLRALSLADGAQIWSTSYEAPFTVEPPARAHGPGPKSTPAYADGRIFTLGISGVLSAVNAADGAVIWRHDFADDFPQAWPIWGASMSPIVVGDRVVAHVGGDRGGALTAFDAASGAVVWANEEFTPGYASPVRTDVAGTDVLVTLSNEHIVAVNVADGTTLWEMPYATSSWQNAVTPLIAGERLVFSGLDMDIFAVNLVPEGNAWAADEVWRSDAQPLYMSSPVRVGGRIFGMTHRRRGQFFCLDAASGEPLWTSRGREGDNAVFTVLGDRIAVLTDAARLLILDAGADSYEPLAEYEAAPSATWAQPAFTPSGVLIKDHSTLALLRF